MKSNKKCEFNVNFQNSNKQVLTAYYNMMFNIHKHISHLIFVLVPDCGEYEICNPILVTIFYICTCDDVTLVNEKSIVS